MPSGYLIPHHYPTFYSIPDQTWFSFESHLAMGSLKYQVLPIIRVSPTFQARQIFQVTHNFRYTNHDMVCRAFDSKLIWLTSSKKEVTPESTLHNVPVNTRNTKPEPARLPDFFSLPDSLLKNPTRWYLSFAVVLPCTSHFCICNCKPCIRVDVL